MAIKIGSNIASFQAQRRLGDATASLSSIYERLSSGQRINRAADDAAGLAIADDLNARTRVYTQAIRNGNDGLSLLAVSDSANEAVSGIVTRIRELTEQAANGTYSNKQREALDNEAQELKKEFLRITQTTSFNGVKVFDGSLGEGLRLQLGYGLEGSINASIGGAIGTGSFGSKLTLATDTGSTSGRSQSVSLGDVNGDGILDLVTAGSANFQGQASVLLGRGDGSFAAALTFAADRGSTSGFSQSLSLGDVNGDGVLDLVTAGYVSNGGIYQGQASVLLGRGDGSFVAALTFATDRGSTSGRSESVSLGDVNGDGILDLVTAGYVDNTGSYQGQASVLLGRGDGSFAAALTFATDTGSTQGRSLSVSLGDINGDGILDLVTAGSANFHGQASVLLGRGDGSFAATRTFATDTGSSSGNSKSVSLGDVNGDGILDLVTAGYVNNVGSYQGQASVLLGLGDGSFADALSFATDRGSTSGFSRSLSLGDVNGDGVLDLVTAGYANNVGSVQGQTSVLLGRGDGSFAAALTFATDRGSTSGFSQSLSLGDVNGDGVLDLVTAGYVNNAGSYRGQASVLLARTEDGLGAMLDFSLKTKADALQAMGPLQRLQDNLAKQRGVIGAAQSRIAIAIQSLASSKENFSAAESRIRDTDIASEAANLIRTQILQQAASSVLAQANQAPALALSLLR